MCAFSHQLRKFVLTTLCPAQFIDAIWVDCDASPEVPTAAISAIPLHENGIMEESRRLAVRLALEPFLRDWKLLWQISILRWNPFHFWACKIGPNPLRFHHFQLAISFKSRWCYANSNPSQKLRNGGFRRGQRTCAWSDESGKRHAIHHWVRGKKLPRAWAVWKRWDWCEIHELWCSALAPTYARIYALRQRAWSCCKCRAGKPQGAFEPQNQWLAQCNLAALLKAKAAKPYCAAVCTPIRPAR